MSCTFSSKSRRCSVPQFPHPSKEEDEHLPCFTGSMRIPEVAYNVCPPGHVTNTNHHRSFIHPTLSLLRGGAPRGNPGLGDWLGSRPRSVSYLSCGFPASVSPLVQLRLRYAREVCGGSGRRRRLHDPSSALGIETPLKSPPRWAPAPAAYKWAQLPTPAASPASSILLSSLSQACLPRVLRHICKPPAGTRALAISCFLSLTRTHAPA